MISFFIAAKKSRDQRKQREESVALRAGFLEKENAVLRAQLSNLTEEKNSLQALLLKRLVSCGGYQLVYGTLR